MQIMLLSLLDIDIVIRRRSICRWRTKSLVVTLPFAVDEKRLPCREMYLRRNIFRQNGYRQRKVLSAKRPAAKCPERCESSLVYKQAVLGKIVLKTILKIENRIVFSK